MSPTEQLAAIYLRSGGGDDEPASIITRQREDCTRIATQHDLTVLREYADIGLPADLNRQAGLQQLLSDLRKYRHVGFVIVWNYSRLARSMDQLDTVIQHVRENEAEVLTISGVEAGNRFVRNGLSGWISRHEEPNDE